MRDDVTTQIETALAKRRAALEAMPLHEVRNQFETGFQIYPDSHSDQENLIQRILVKVRAELEHHS